MSVIHVSERGMSTNNAALSTTASAMSPSRTAPAHHRGATLSLLYLFSYLLQALTAIGAGALATNLGLQGAVEIAAPILGALAATAIVLAVVDVTAARRLAAA